MSKRTYRERVKGREGNVVKEVEKDRERMRKTGRERKCARGRETEYVCE